MLAAIAFILRLVALASESRAASPAEPTCADAVPIAASDAPGAADTPIFGASPRFFVETPTPLRGVLQDVNRPWSLILQPGALVPADPLSNAASAVREKLGTIGLHYSLTQAINFAALTEPVGGDSTLGSYSFQFNGNWDLFQSDDLGGTTGWLSLECIGGTGFGFDWQQENIRARRNALISPNNNAWGLDFAFEELAWAQSFAGGELVVSGGLVNQQNAIDLNRYASTAYGQLLNSAFVNNAAIPFATNNLGLVVQWQPLDWLYVMGSVAANNQTLGSSPFQDVSFENATYLGEVGFVMRDLGGLGPGLWRVQPFLATVDGATGGGAALNIEQQLGRDGPFGAFGRFGIADDVSASVNGIRASAAGGLAMLSPFARDGFFSHDNSDYAAIGLSWAQAPRTPGVDTENEFAIETTLVFQLTPTMTLQPDLQLIWNDARTSSNGPELVFQLQLNVAW